MNDHIQAEPPRPKPDSNPGAYCGVDLRRQTKKKKNWIVGVWLLAAVVAVVLLLSFWVTLPVVGDILAGFHSPPGPWPESTFYRACDLNGLTTKLREQQQQDWEWMGASTSQGMDSGRGKLHRNGPQVSFKEWSREFPLKPEGMPEYLKALEDHVKKLLAGSGAELDQREADADGFSLHYTAGRCKGSVDARFEKTATGYQLRIRLEEKQR